MSGPPPDVGLPPAWTIELDPTTRRVDRGTALLGGSPFRMLRLSDAGARWLNRVVRDRPALAATGPRRLARRLVDAGLAVARPGGTPALNRSDLDVIVPTEAASDGLRETLGALPMGPTVTVVDDAGPDPDAVDAIVRTTSPIASVLHIPRNLGPGGARDRGIATTRGAVIVLVDADVVPEPGGLDALLAHFDDPMLGAVAPRIVADGTEAPTTLARYEAVRSPLDLGPAGAEVRPLSRVSYVPTTMLLVRREAYDDVGGFDVDLRVGEDVDLVWRLVGRGWRVRYDPSVTATHPVRQTWRAWLRQRCSYGGSAADLCARHGRAVAPLVLSGWSALTWALVVAGHPGPAALVAAGTTVAFVPKLRGLDQPTREALRVAGLGHLWAGRSVGRCLWRTWWPFSVALALTVRRTRPALAAALVVPPLLDWWSHRELDPVRHLALSVADDVAYGAGVWSGCIRQRDVGALLPSFTGPIKAASDADAP